MKIRLFLAALIIFSLPLTACAQKGVNDNTAMRNTNTPTRVKYNIPDQGGPGISGVDVSDRGLDRNVNRQNNNVVNVRDNNLNNTNGSRMRVADEAARKVEDLPGVQHANVIVTNNNAFVAAKLDRSVNNGHTKNIEDQISRTVKSIDKDIDRVYISENPDFYKRMNNYASDIRNGRPVSGFFDEFSKTIRRIFPDVK